MDRFKMYVFVFAVNDERVRVCARTLEIAREYVPENAPLIDQYTLLGTWAEEGTDPLK